MRAVKFLAVVGILVAAVGQATAPATQPAPTNSIVKTLNAISRDMWPVAGETTTHRSAREKLVGELLGKGTKVPSLTGKIIDTAEKEIPVFNPGPRPAGALGLKPDSFKSVQFVSLDCGAVDVWGSPAKVTATAEVDVSAAVGRGWVKGQEITISGETKTGVAVGMGEVEIMLGECRLIPAPKPKVMPKVAATAPAPQVTPLPTTHKPAYTYPTQP